MVAVQACARGQVGFGWTYASAAAADVVRETLADVVRGRDALDVPAAWSAMQKQLRNVGRPGIASCALAAVDVALWDLAARLLDVPLVRLLGRARDDVPVYGSGGFTSYDDETLRSQLRGWVDGDGIPRGWIRRMKRTSRTLVWRFNADRMVMDYALKCYVLAAGGTSSDMSPTL